MFKKPIELECRPVLKDVICAFGEKCFHNIHYICETINGECIPSDACPFNAIVNNLQIHTVSRTNGCVRITGTYDIFVWFRFNGQRMIGQAERLCVPFNVQVPIFAVNDGCKTLVCEDGEILGTQVCALNTRLDIIEAVVERDVDHHHHHSPIEVCPDCEFRLKIVVEKIFQAFEHGPQVLCIPVCPPEACPTPTEGPIGGECPPLTRPTKCPDFCRQDEVFNPDNCDQCPPPQVCDHRQG
ncbi:hypothetical protein [Zhaonella formicivorans]|uniref:hypothetical protein n=1 Tax=Zhaonella formicivorans TaxID=2528593 RepID=UPI0010EBC050|nr:hypothetical protein [Zhaonella formicivorans]